MLQVLQVLGPSTGGIRAHVAALRDGLRERGWEVAVAGPAGVLGGLGGVDWVAPIPNGPRSAALARAWQALRWAGRSADLVHAHGLKAGWVASLVPGHPPLVLTVHNTVLAGQAGPLEGALRRLEGWLPGRVDQVIATSPGLAAALAGRVDAARLHTVRPVGPRPVPRRSSEEVRAALGVDGAAPLVVGVGRLHPQKGWPVLIEAAACLVDQWPRLQVVVLGEGPDRGALEASVRRRGLQEVVRFVGPSANPADELAAADVVVAPSTWESGPLVVAEALWLARPVVATPVGFVPELVSRGRSGWLVAVGDGPGLAGAIGAALADPTHAAAMGAAGRQQVADVLDPDRLVAGVEAVYRAALR